MLSMERPCIDRQVMHGVCNSRNEGEAEGREERDMTHIHSSPTPPAGSTLFVLGSTTSRSTTGAARPLYFMEEQETVPEILNDIASQANNPGSLTCC